MAFAVRIADSAIRDAAEYHAYILKQSHDHFPADSWVIGLNEAIVTLGQLPNRCPIIPEPEDFPKPLRQLLYGSHRIIFEVEADTVQVLRVYHSSLRPLKSLTQRPQLKKPS